MRLGQTCTKLATSRNFRLHSSSHFCYKQFTESSGVASRSYCLQLSGFVRHLSSRERKTLNRPGHGTSFGKHHNSEGYLQSKDLQRDLFSISCLPCSACAESGVLPRLGRPYCCAYRAPIQEALSFRAKRGILVSLAALPPSLPQPFPMWKSSGNSVGSAN
jgi:hypothetical protein